MTKENLLKGQEILEELEKLSHTQDIWNNASKIASISLYIVNRFTPNECVNINGNFINFEDLKVLCIDLKVSLNLLLPLYFAWQ